jgi:hypothetical protein
MYDMRYFFLIVVCFISLKMDAQKKVSFEIDGSVLKSIGKDIPAYHKSTTNPTLTYAYYSRLKYEKTYFNLLAHIQYNLTSCFSAGIESGIYFHLEEKYFSDMPENSVYVSMRVMLSDKIVDVKSKPLCIQFAAGPLFFNMQNKYAKLNNGATYSAKICYDWKKKRGLSIGIEKEIDNTTFYFYPLTSGYKAESYHFKLKRLSLSISYRYIF